jgi:DUF1365 family protein
VTTRTVGARHALRVPATSPHSALYEGILHHRRWGPGGAHEFTYRVAMPLIDLDEVEAVTSLHPLWSRRLPAPVWFRRADFLGDPSQPLDEAVRDLVSERSGDRPRGRIALLANLRTWGWLFNPISFYFCYSADGSTVGQLAVEVENTPWHERCQYVVGAPGYHQFPKSMHVSPFLPMDVDYRLCYGPLGERLVVRFSVLRQGQRLFEATLSLRRRPLDRDGLGRMLWHHPAPPHRVSAGIYAQAVRLAIRGKPFFAHPRRQVAASTEAGRRGP